MSQDTPPLAMLDIPAYEGWLYEQPGTAAIEHLDPRDKQCKVVVVGARQSVCEALSGNWHRYVPNGFLRAVKS